MSISFEAFQRLALENAIYPRHQNDLDSVYPALGLTEEAGEVSGEVKKMIRDDGGVMTNDRRERIAEELGDVLWYIAAICRDVGVPMEDVAFGQLAKLKRRKAEGKIKGSGRDR